MTTTTFGQPRRAVVCYEQAHLRLRRWRGRADTMPCVDCGETARHWAYMGGDPNELRNAKGLAYSLDFDRYQPKCVPCHFRKDRATAAGHSIDVCPRGHLWAENESIRRKRSGRVGLRFCRACHRENNRARAAA